MPYFLFQPVLLQVHLPTQSCDCALGGCFLGTFHHLQTRGYKQAERKMVLCFRFGCQGSTALRSLSGQPLHAVLRKDQADVGFVIYLFFLEKSSVLEVVEQINWHFDAWFVFICVVF